MYHYKNLDTTNINWDGIKFPMNMCDFDRLEHNNTVPYEDELVLTAVNVYTPYKIAGNLLYNPKRIGKYFNKAIHKIELL